MSNKWIRNRPASIKVKIAFLLIIVSLFPNISFANKIESSTEDRKRELIGDIVRQKLAQCWAIPAGIKDAELLRVVIRIKLDVSGELIGKPQVVKGRDDSDSGRMAVASAIRAILKCAPFDLPAEDYEFWSDMIIRFDPGNMF